MVVCPSAYAVPTGGLPIKEGDEFVWEITRANGSPAFWWHTYPNGSYETITYTFEKGGLLKFKITKITEEEVYGSLTVGNLTLDNTTLSEISCNLALAPWPYHKVFSLMVPTDWEYLSKVARENMSLTVSERDIWYFTGSSLWHLHVVIISGTFKGFAEQQVYLVYDKQSGVLIEGMGKFGNFEIYLELRDVKSDAFRPLNFILVIVGVSIAVVVILIAALSLRRRVPK